MYKPQNKTFYCRYQDSGSRDITTINQVIIICKDSRAEQSSSLSIHSYTLLNTYKTAEYNTNGIYSDVKFSYWGIFDFIHVICCFELVVFIAVKIHIEVIWVI